MNLSKRGNAEETAPPAGVLPTAGTGHDGRRWGTRRLQRGNVVERSGVVVLLGHSWLKSGVHGGGRSEGEGN